MSEREAQAGSCGEAYLPCKVVLSKPLSVAESPKVKCCLFHGFQNIERPCAVGILSGIYMHINIINEGRK